MVERLVVGPSELAGVIQEKAEVKHPHTLVPHYASQMVLEMGKQAEDRFDQAEEAKDPRQSLTGLARQKARKAGRKAAELEMAQALSGITMAEAKVLIDETAETAVP